MKKFWHHFDRQFTPRALRLLFWFVMIFMFTFSCVKKVQTNESSNLGVCPNWCFRADFLLNDKIHTYSWNCFEREITCNRALAVSKKYGSLADVTSLTTCKKIDD